MKEYVYNFLDEYSYPQTTKTAVLSVFDCIDESMVDNIMQTYQSETDFDFDALTSIVDEIAQTINVNVYTVRLFSLICLTEKMRKAYEKSGIPENHLKDTLKNVLYESKKCRKEKGVEGITQWHGYCAVLQAKRFALGRLEFELSSFDKEYYEKDGNILQNGDSIIRVYVPFTGKPLFEGEFEAALFYARTFFAQYYAHIFNRGKIAYVLNEIDFQEALFTPQEHIFFEKIPCSVNKAYTARDIEQDLRALGIKEGDTLLVHSSFKSLGQIEGGAKTLVDTLLKVLGKDGTLMFPTLSYRYVNNKTPYFHLKGTESCVGYLTEYFRTQVEGAKRSRHLTHSCCAIGKNADFLIDGHEKDTVMIGENSPLVKLTKIDGKIFFLGCCLHSNTLMHGVEEIVQPPYYYCNAPIEEYIFDDGNIREIRTLKRQTFKETGTSQRYARIWDLLDETEKAKGYVLDAKSYVLSAKAVWKKGIEKMKEYPFFFVDSRMEEI